MRFISRIILVVFFTTFLNSCSDNELTIPKPPTFLRTDLPNHTYVTYKDHGHFTCEFSKNYLVKPVVFGNIVTDHLEVNLGPLNGTLYVNYFPLANRDTLVRYINLSNDKVDEHQMKADRIIDKQIIDEKRKVYGTFFEFQGNVATNFQFYLTDSINHFVRGEVLMNCRPNYDSLRPSLDYLKQDLIKLFDSFEWKN
jgi:gliding motility-associated lipoprotein GldD